MVILMYFSCFALFTVDLIMLMYLCSTAWVPSSEENHPPSSMNYLFVSPDNLWEPHHVICWLGCFPAQKTPPPFEVCGFVSLLEIDSNQVWKYCQQIFCHVVPYDPCLWNLAVVSLLKVTCLLWLMGKFHCKYCHVMSLLVWHCQIQCHYLGHQ